MAAQPPTLLMCLVLFFILLQYEYYTNHLHSIHLPHTNPHKHVYVSMTTMPGRIGSLQAVLESLLNQTYPVTTIFLVLPYYSVKEAREYIIPDFIADLQPTVQLVREKIDWGPATKFIPMIQRFKEWRLEDELIIVLDDDQIYPDRMVEQYVKWSARLPDAALTLRGHKMLESFKWLKMAGTNIMQSVEMDDLDCVDIVTGVGSFLVRPRFFTSELWTGMYREDEPGRLKREVRSADDIWVSGQLAKNGISRYVIPGRVNPITPDMEFAEYMEGMIIKPLVKRKFLGTHMHELAGGLVGDNEHLMRQFKPYWSCYGQRNTVVPCAQLHMESYPEFKGKLLCADVFANLEYDGSDGSTTA